MSSYFTDEERQRISGEALTIFERVERLDSLRKSDHDPDATTERFAEWCETFGGKETLDRRLDHDGYTLQDCRTAIQPTEFAPSASLPDWIETLDEVGTILVEAEPTFDSERQPDAVPFEQFFSQLATYARSQVSDQVGEAIPSTALDSLQSWLRDILSGSFKRMLYVEFKTYLAIKAPSVAFSGHDGDGAPPTDHYETFVSQLFGDRFRQLCIDYPVFARLVATRIDQWVAFVEQFYTRLTNDYEAITEQLGDSEPLGDLRDVEPLADDTHGGGQAVLRVTFESGTDVVYKPRSVDAGVAFYTVVERLEPHLSIPAFQRPKFISRDGYGWMESISPVDCRDHAAVGRYYERAGSLLCLGYLLGFVDCHQENLIANGEYPVLIDCEPALHPPATVDTRPVDDLTFSFVDESVLRVGLLPWRADIDGAEQIDQNLANEVGFGAEAVEKNLSAYEVTTVDQVNTDFMSISKTTPTVDLRANTPTVGGEGVPPSEYAQALLSGFRETYQTISELSANGSLRNEIQFVSEFEGIENRFLFRGTHEYLSKVGSISKSVLESGVWFSIDLEELAVPFFDGQIDSLQLWPLYAAERRAIRQLDPPRFTTQTDNTAIHDSSGRTDAEVTSTSIEALEDRLDQMSTVDMERQLRVIKYSLGVEPESPGVPVSVGSDPCSQSADTVIRNAATSLLDQVEAATVSLPNGSEGWISILDRPDAKTLFLNRVSDSMYSGRSGVAIAQAGAYSVTGDERYRQLALDTIEPVRASIRAGKRVANGRIGGGNGLGSVIYTLCLCGELLSEQGLTEDAVTAACRVDNDLVHRAETNDVLGGTAGLLLGLLALDDRLEDQSIDDCLVSCGEAILADCIQTRSGHSVWPTKSDGRPLTGFSHGVSGIAYALYRLGSTVEDSRFTEAAREAVEYESTVYSDSQQNWSDHREQTETEFVDQWCHGRTGVALSRIGAMRYTDLPERRDRIRRCVDATRDAVPLTFDHLCCGNAGRTELLLAAEKTLECERGTARKYLYRALLDDGSVSVAVRGDTQEFRNPTFFLGLSGISYTMLRTLPKSTLPNVLLWE